MSEFSDGGEGAATLHVDAAAAPATESLPSRRYPEPPAAVGPWVGLLT